MKGVKNSLYNCLRIADISLTFFLFPSPFALASRSLARRAGAELTGDALQVARNLDTRFEEEELEVASLVLELDLVAVFEDFTDAASCAVESENLAPVWALDALKTIKQGLFFF